MPYKLWAKKSQNWKIDCSWLLSDYWVKNNIFSTQERAYNLNAFQLFSRWKEKDIAYLERWDVIFFLDLNNENVNHIAVFLEWSWSFLMGSWFKARIFDATFNNWVSKRNITITYKDWKFYTESNWYKYKLRFATNPLVEKYKWLHTERDFKVTNYYTPTVIDSWNQINCWWSCDVTADWHKLEEKDAWVVFACPKEYPLWIKIQVWDRVGMCRDRWWIIVMSWQKNSRWNVSKESHIDIRMWFEYQWNSKWLKQWVYKVNVIE